MTMPRTAAITTLTHGTGVPIDERFAVPMDDMLHMVDPAANPFLTIFKRLRSRPVRNYEHRWMMRQGHARRTFIGKWIKETVDSDIILGIRFDARYWNAIAAMPTANEASPDDDIRLMIYCKGAGETTDNSIIAGNIKRLAMERGRGKTRYLYNAAGAASTLQYTNAIWISGDAVDEAAMITNQEELVCDATDSVFDPADVTDGADCYVELQTPNDQIQYAQGSGLGQEMKNVSWIEKNYTEIFKDHVTVAGTLMSCDMIGPDERTLRRMETLASHASDIEKRILFKGGGTMGLGGDWGMVVGGDNPTTLMRGLGIGHASGKEGLIQSLNGNPLHAGCADAQVSASDWGTWIDFMEKLYDDQQGGSQNKLCFTSTYVIGSLTKLCMGSDSPFTLSRDVPYSGPLGLNVTRVITPFGNLDLVLHPMINGPYYKYGLILDMKNCEWRPLQGRDTRMIPDAHDRQFDGVLDWMLTEGTLELRNEWTSAIMYLTS